MMIQSKRLESVLKMVDAGETIGDIGCDHGYISFALLKEGRAQKVVATDISAPSLEKARSLLSMSFDPSRFSLRVGDGFEPMDEGELTAAIIMGMGGRLIADIVDRGKEKVAQMDYVILQPMQGAEDLFEYLNKEGFSLIDVDLVEERDKFYPVMKLKGGAGDNITWATFAPLDAFSAMVQRELKRLRTVREAVAKSGKEELIQKADDDVKRWEEYLEDH